MSRNYYMPLTANASADIITLLDQQYEATGFNLFKAASEELSRLYSLIRAQPIDVEQYTPDVKIRMGVVMKITAKYFNISQSDLVSPSRAIRFAIPRQFAMYLARDLSELSYPQIAAWFNRDHTTILHGVEKIKTQIGQNPKIKEMIDEITALCKHEAMDEYRRKQEVQACPTKTMFIQLKPRKSTQPAEKPQTPL